MFSTYFLQISFAPTKHQRTPFICSYFPNLGANLRTRSDTEAANFAAISLCSTVSSVAQHPPSSRYQICGVTNSQSPGNAACRFSFQWFFRRAHILENLWQKVFMFPFFPSVAWRVSFFSFFPSLPLTGCNTWCLFGFCFFQSPCWQKSDKGSWWVEL